MNARLNTVGKEIENLEQQLEILQKEKKKLEAMENAPSDVIGKYLKVGGEIETIYIHIKSVEPVSPLYTKQGIYFILGPRIQVLRRLIGTTYLLYNAGAIHSTDKYEEITKEEFDGVLNEAFNAMKE